MLAQTNGECELIVVDDGSTDETPSVLAAFGNRIHVIRQKNQGVSAARNAGICAARGEWVAFLDSDDLWTPEKLAVQIHDVELHPEAVAHIVDAAMIGYSQENLTLFGIRGCIQVYQEHPFRPRPLLDVLRVQFFTPTWLVKRSVMQRAGPFRTDFHIFEDFEMLTRLALEGPFVVRPFKGVIVRRVGSASEALSHQFNSGRRVALSNYCAIYDSLLARTDLNAPERREIGRSVSGARFELFTVLRQAGQGSEARRALRQSVADCFGLRSLVRAAMGLAGGSRLVDALKDSTLRPERLFRRSAVDRSTPAAHPPGGSIAGAGLEEDVAKSDTEPPSPCRPCGT